MYQKVLCTEGPTKLSLLSINWIKTNRIDSAYIFEQFACKNTFGTVDCAKLNYISNYKCGYIQRKHLRDHALYKMCKTYLTLILQALKKYTQYTLSMYFISKYLVFIRLLLD